MDSAAPGQRWVFFSPDTTSRTYALALTDSATADLLVEIEFALVFGEDSTTLARLRRDPALRARRSRDSAFVESWSGRADSRLFHACLGRLAGRLYLDIGRVAFPDYTAPVGELLIPVHRFWQASLESGRLQLSPLNDEWLGAMIDSGTVSVAHERLGNGALLLTARTEELQRLVASFAQDTMAFPPKRAITLRR